MLLLLHCWWLTRFIPPAHTAIPPISTYTHIHTYTQNHTYTVFSSLWTRTNERTRAEGRESRMFPALGVSQPAVVRSGAVAPRGLCYSSHPRDLRGEKYSAERGAHTRARANTDAHVGTHMSRRAIGRLSGVKGDRKKSQPSSDWREARRWGGRVQNGTAVPSDFSHSFHPSPPPHTPLHPSPYVAASASHPRTSRGCDPRRGSPRRLRLERDRPSSRKSTPLRAYLSPSAFFFKEVERGLLLTGIVSSRSLAEIIQSEPSLERPGP